MSLWCVTRVVVWILIHVAFIDISILPQLRDLFPENISMKNVFEKRIAMNKIVKAYITEQKLSENHTEAHQLKYTPPRCFLVC